MIMKYDETICPLSGRETEVLQLILNEMTTSEMAAELFLSNETIRTHRKNLMNKLNAKNVAGMVRKAFETGLVQLSN